MAAAVVLLAAVAGGSVACGGQCSADVDCGGGSCPACQGGKCVAHCHQACEADADCVDLNCHACDPDSKTCEESYCGYHCSTNTDCGSVAGKGCNTCMNGPTGKPLCASSCGQACQDDSVCLDPNCRRCDPAKKVCVNGPAPTPAPTTPPPPTPAPPSPTPAPVREVCMAAANATDAQMQAALQYACQNLGSVCDAVKPGGKCYMPNDLRAHTDFALEQFYSRDLGTCGFSGSAQLVKCDQPSTECAPCGPAPTPVPLTPSPTNLTCVANRSASEDELKSALGYVCGVIDCAEISKGGVCYDPNTLIAHCDWAFDKFVRGHHGDCSFKGAAEPIACETAPTVCQPCPPTAPPTPAPTAWPTPAPPPAQLCVAKPDADTGALNNALQYACNPTGGGVDCSPINGGGSKYFPNTLVAHANYAFGQYYLKHQATGSCDFGGTAMLVSRRDCATCRATAAASDAAMLAAIGNLCAGGICPAIADGGLQYFPNTTRDHFNWAVSTYFDAVWMSYPAGSKEPCNFTGLAELASCPAEPSWQQAFLLNDGIDPSVWQPSATMAGDGNNEFQVYTGRDRENIVTEDGTLYLRPGLTRGLPATPGGKPLGEAGVLGCGRTKPSEANSSTCPTPKHVPYQVPDCTDTGSRWRETSGCFGTSGSEFYSVSGNLYYTVLPPATSARITSHSDGDKAVNLTSPRSFKYGRLEIRARLPKGDWLWPAIWMLPTDNVYGSWPRSGEVDIVESRGNAAQCSDAKPGGTLARNGFKSTLHWGPSSDAGGDAFRKTSTQYRLPSGDMSDNYHTFGIRWNESRLYTYLDRDDQRVLDVSFAEIDFWKRGKSPQTSCSEESSDFAACAANVTQGPGTASGWSGPNPWQNGSKAAPFDQEFFLAIQVAVGGTGSTVASGDGYWPDGWCNKPWRDRSGYGAGDFYAAVNSWWPTWSPADPMSAQAGKNGSLAVRWIRYWDEKSADRR